MSLRALVWLGLPLAAALLACDDGGTDGDADVDADLDGDEDGDRPDGSEDGDVDGDGGPTDPFAVTGVNPNHGTFEGFTPVIVRGRGFEEGAQVFFGEHEVHPATVTVQDENRILCATPPGEPDTWVDVTVRQGDDSATLEQGFHYDPCRLSPTLGTVAGGTYVVISCLGTELSAGLSVAFDDVEAVDVEVASPTEVRCRTPRGTVGPADVLITDVSGDIDLPESFTYFETTDPTSGGLGGDPVAGNIEVTVFDAMTGAPLPDTFVILGVDTGTEYQGRTDEGGHYVFSGPDLSGRQVIITASHAPVPTPIDMDCDDVPDMEATTYYETASFTEFDATYVTVVLNPIPPMVMVPPCDPPPDPVPSYIEGELQFQSGEEFGPYDWEIVPEPIPPDEVKRSYVFTTAEDTFYDELWGELYETGTIDPGEGSIVTEDDVGENGFTYRIESRYGALAVYALAGIYNTRTHEFNPYAFGIRRGVLVPPGETVSTIDLLMVTPLDQSVLVTLDEPPTPIGYDMGPNRYEIELYVDLGVEGVIWRADRRSVSSLPAAVHMFSSWMPRDGALSDATLTVVGMGLTYYTDPLTGREQLTYPISMRWVRGVTDWLADVVVDDWIGSPQPVEPDWGGVMRDHIEWEPGPGNFDFSHIMLTRGRPYWDIILPGEQVVVDLPPLPAEMVPDAPDVQIDVWHHRILPGFDYDHWTYSHLYRDVQVAYGANAWLATY